MRCHLPVFSLLAFMFACSGPHATENSSGVNAVTYTPTKVNTLAFFLKANPGSGNGAITPAMVGNNFSPTDCPECAAGDSDGYGPKLTIVVNNETFEGKVKIRGGLTRQFPKKSFSVKFSGKEGPLLAGMRHNKIILNASYNDPTFLRQFIVLNTQILTGGYASNVDFAAFKVAGDFSKRGGEKISNPAQVRQSLYILFEDYKDGAKAINGGKKSQIVKNESDCDWGNCGANNFFEESDLLNKTAEEQAAVRSEGQMGANIVNSMCHGGNSINIDSYYRWQYINHFFYDRDSITKNYILFQKNGGQFYFWHWDADATMGYMPDGSIYGDFADITTDEPWGRKRNRGDAWAEGCMRSQDINRYKQLYRDAVVNVMHPDKVTAWLNATRIVDVIRPYAQADINAWSPRPGTRSVRDNNFDNEVNFMLSNFRAVGNANINKFNLR